MGANYYLESNICEHCGRGDADRHIGKSSVGWCFALHVYPDEGINDLKDWANLFLSPKTRIMDEYRTYLKPLEMINIIKNRSNKERKSPGLPYKDWEDFHMLNHSADGPNNLVRSKIERTCIGHGKGTWDLIVGDFS